MINKEKKQLEIIITNSNKRFVRVRKDSQSEKYLEQRASLPFSQTESHSKQAWTAIHEEGIKEIMRPAAFQDMNDKDAHIVKKAFIDSMKMMGLCVLNNPKTRASLKVA